MTQLPQETINLVLSGLMGMFGGLFTIPINAIFTRWLKREELLLQHRLDLIARKRELLLEHQLEMKGRAKDHELAEIKMAVTRLEKSITNE
jgi:hypothetical protein